MGEELTKMDYGILAIEKMGTYIAQSGLFGVKTPAQAIALMLIAQAEGRHPASAAMDYHIIQNRPALKADTMLARFQAAGGVVKWLEYTDSKVAATFGHPQGGTVTIDWDMERAKRAGLGLKDNWKTYPRAMLRARVISEGVRTVYPAVLGGMYTPEEVMDFPVEAVVEPQKSLPEPAKIVLDPFVEMVDAEHLDDRRKELLELYLASVQEKSGKVLESIKRSAVKEQKRFWSGFDTFVSNYDVPQTFPTKVQEGLV